MTEPKHAGHSASKGTGDRVALDKEGKAKRMGKKEF